MKILNIYYKLLGGVIVFKTIIRKFFNIIKKNKFLSILITIVLVAIFIVLSMYYADRKLRLNIIEEVNLYEKCRGNKIKEISRQCNLPFESKLDFYKASNEFDDYFVFIASLLGYNASLKDLSEDDSALKRALSEKELRYSDLDRDLLDAWIYPDKPKTHLSVNKVLQVLVAAIKEDNQKLYKELRLSTKTASEPLSPDVIASNVKLNYFLNLDFGSGIPEFVPLKIIFNEKNKDLKRVEISRVEYDTKESNWDHYHFIKYRGLSIGTNLDADEYYVCLISYEGIRSIAEKYRSWGGLRRCTRIFELDRGSWYRLFLEEGPRFINMDKDGVYAYYALRKHVNYSSFWQYYKHKVLTLDEFYTLADQLANHLENRTMFPKLNQYFLYDNFAKINNHLDLSFQENNKNTELGKLYIPSVVNSYTTYNIKHSTVSVGGSSSFVSERTPEEHSYSTGGYDTNISGFKKVYRIENKSIDNYIIEIRAKWAETYSKAVEETYCLDRSFLICTESGTRYKRQQYNRPATYQNQYLLSQNGRVKHDFDLGEKEPEDFLFYYSHFEKLSSGELKMYDYIFNDKNIFAKDTLEKIGDLKSNYKFKPLYPFLHDREKLLKIIHSIYFHSKNVGKVKLQFVYDKESFDADLKNKVTLIVKSKEPLRVEVSTPISREEYQLEDQKCRFPSCLYGYQYKKEFYITGYSEEALLNSQINFVSKPAR